MYELARQHGALKAVTAHPEFNHITTVVMMVLDSMDAALKKETEEHVSVEVGREEQKDYEKALDKLAKEVQSWSFLYKKGEAKYEFEDCDSAAFFLSYAWELLHQYCADLDF